MGAALAVIVKGVAGLCLRDENALRRLSKADNSNWLERQGQCLPEVIGPEIKYENASEADLYRLQENTLRSNAKVNVHNLALRHC